MKALSRLTVMTGNTSMTPSINAEETTDFELKFSYVKPLEVMFIEKKN
jgi:hypothetical protein